MGLSTFSFSLKGSPTLILNSERSHSSFQITKILVTGKSFLPRNNGVVTQKDLELLFVSVEKCSILKLQLLPCVSG
jgi:hypothetical protein